MAVCRPPPRIYRGRNGRSRLLQLRYCGLYKYWTYPLTCSVGSEAAEAAQKLAYQYQSRLKREPQPGRRWFIARDRSYHGATLGALAVGGHKGRKDMYKQILPSNTQFISPCNPYRDMDEGETVVQYIDRLADELDRKICELGPETVAGFFMEPVVGAVSCAHVLQVTHSCSLTHSCRHSDAFRRCLAISQP